MDFLSAISSLFQWPARQRQFIEEYEFPLGLVSRFAGEHSHLKQRERDLIWQGLRQYFLMCHMSKKRMVSMPSQIVDEAWHAFILFTRDYQEFCHRGFGRYLHHTPAEAMSTPTLAQDGIKRAWRLACKQENINPLHSDRLPLIFALDGQLNVPNGFVYRIDCMAAQASTLSATRSDYCAMHIGCSSGCGGSGCSGDTSSDGGSSCGSSCGGGCGGD